MTFLSRIARALSLGLVLNVTGPGAHSIYLAARPRGLEPNSAQL